ncbi:MAG TPA: alkaline phosphatase family protein [Terriglobales bacterium]|nr:alkaline phosphatase family protein [Terriglobales bacterium]
MNARRFTSISLTRFQQAGGLLLAACLMASCGGSSQHQPSTSAAEGSTPPAPSLGSVTVVVLQNTSYSSVIDNPAMPYLNSLAKKYALATNYFGDSSDSRANAFMLTAGQKGADEVFTGDNIVRQLINGNASWKAYMESLPQAGYLGEAGYPYEKRHNPFAFFSDVINVDEQRLKIVPFSQFASDLAADSLPRYAYISPNERNNGHDCPSAIPACSTNDKLAAADMWLQINIAPLLTSAHYTRGGLVVIVFDSADSSDRQHGGGHVAAIFIHPRIKAGYQASQFAQHPSTLRLAVEGLGLTTLPGASATAPRLSDMFSVNASN